MDLVINRKLKQIRDAKRLFYLPTALIRRADAHISNNNMSDAQEFDALIYPIQYDTFADVQRMKNQTIIVPPTQPSPIPSKNPSPLPFPLPTGGIGTPSRQGTTAEDYKKADEYLNDLANRTDGRLYQAQTTVNLAKAFSNIAEELRSLLQYRILSEGKGKTGRKTKLES